MSEPVAGDNEANARIHKVRAKERTKVSSNQLRGVDLSSIARDAVIGIAAFQRVCLRCIRSDSIRTKSLKMKT